MIANSRQRIDYGPPPVRVRAAFVVPADPAAFIAGTKIEVPDGVTTAIAPFTVWPAQARVLHELQARRLVLMLKARQIGMTWITCGYTLWRCLSRAQTTALLFSQGQLEANELIRRVVFLYEQHADRASLPALVKNNTTELEWANGSRIKALPATRKAGRSFTASLIVLDEFAFMLWASELLAAVKPTIDGGGQLIVLSSADGANTPFHQFWIAAESGANGYAPLFLPWTARPDRGPTWRDEKLREANGDTATIYREYPANPIEAFTNAAGLVFDVWADPGNVTADAEYVPDGGPVLWALDDGYSAGAAPATAGRDPHTGQYVADAHPRVVLWVQQRDDGRLCVFHERYACLKLSDAHLAEALSAPYPPPEFVTHGPGAAEIRGRIHAAGLYARQSTADVEESIKELRRALVPDANGWRRILVHPRCTHLRSEFASYRRDAATGKVVKAFDHGPDALRSLTWLLRHQG